MAQLDRFLSVMVANHADSIQLIESDVATLQKDGVPRPITRQPLTAQQLLHCCGRSRQSGPPSSSRRVCRRRSTIS